MEMAIERYGEIKDGVWPLQDYWLKSLLIPEDWFPNWFVMNTNKQVHSIYCNIDMHPALFNALKAVKAAGAAPQLHTFDGAFNIRSVRGCNLLSAHSYGLAIDINASMDPLGSSNRWPDSVVSAFKSQGFDYGGDFHGRLDPMHASFCWE